MRFSKPATANDPMTEESVAAKIMLPCCCGDEANMSTSIVGPQYCRVYWLQLFPTCSIIGTTQLG